MRYLLALAFVCSLFDSPASAQIRLNEVFSTHCGVDDHEFVELRGPAGASLDGWLLCAVEGDHPNIGRLDRAFDLTGAVVPTDGYFVVGDVATSNVDLVVATTDAFPNGTSTLYLLHSTDPAAIVALLGLNLDTDGDRVTDLVTHPSVTSVEAVGFAGPGFPAQDLVLDCAPVFGPLQCGFGPLRVAGIFRPLDSAKGWASSEFLDFNNTGACGGGGCPSTVSSTPGWQNPGSGSASVPSGAGCGSVGPIGAAYCGPAVVNSSGLPGELAAFGSTAVADNYLRLTASQLPTGQFGYFLGSTQQGATVPPGSDGLLCLAQPVVRFVQAGLVGQGPSFARSLDLAHFPSNPGGPVLAGETWNFQCWYRDGVSSNFTSATSILFE